MSKLSREQYHVHSEACRRPLRPREDVIDRAAQSVGSIGSENRSKSA